MTDRAEVRIKQLEEESRHEHAMRLLQGGRIDAHDVTLDRVGIQFEQIGVQIKELVVAQAKTEAMLQDLIRVIAREHSNGGSKA